MRGLGILIIVIGHHQIAHEHAKYLQLIMVPFFFFASGFLFNPDRYPDPRQFLRRRLRGLVIPYFAFAIIGWLFWALTAAIWMLIAGEVKTAALGMLVVNLVGIPFGIAKFMPYNLPLWFLTCLFCTDQIFYHLRRNVDSDKALIGWMILLSAIGFVIGRRLPLPLPWNIDTALTVLIYYGAGYLFRKNWGEGGNFAWYLKLPLALALLALSIAISTFNPQTHLMANDIGRFIPFHLASVVGVPAFVYLSQLLAWCRPINYFGRQSLILLGMHIIAMGMFGIFANQVLGMNAKELLPSTPWAMFYGSGTLLLLVPMIYAINRWFPWILGRPRKKKTQPAAS